MGLQGDPFRPQAGEEPRPRLPDQRVRPNAGQRLAGSATAKGLANRLEPATRRQQKS